MRGQALCLSWLLTSLLGKDLLGLLHGPLAGREGSEPGGLPHRAPGGAGSGEILRWKDSAALVPASEGRHSPEERTEKGRFLWYVGLR